MTPSTTTVPTTSGSAAETATLLLSPIHWDSEGVLKGVQSHNPPQGWSGFLQLA